ncbi:MAG: IS66 family transposase [Calditrichaeota bacterium]|nr:MAG: IS66 family transposase [Calditrichota bacterium]
MEQIIEEIPPVQLRVIRLTTFKGQCVHCGEVRSTHPLQVSKAVGAAGVQLGPNALSILLQLQYRWHLSKRKSCELVKQLFGLSITPGGLVSATHRLAKQLDKNYQALQEQARSAAVVHSDETGWYVGSPGYTLWVFTNQQLTFYRVVAARTRAELQHTLGKDFSGVLVSDCLSIYDEATPIQHKCYSHHLKAISKAIQQHPQGESDFLREVKMLLKTAMIIKKLKKETEPEVYQQWCNNLEKRADALLLTEPRGQPQEEAVRHRLSKQRDHLFTFLYYDDVDATNNLAERQLRPAVMARKISCGNRTARGAQTWEIIASLAATCAQTHQSLADLIIEALALDPTPKLTR